MLHDSMTVEDIVDSESALEFMKEATKLASSSELEDLSERVIRKSECFRTRLSPEGLETLDEEQFGQVVRLVFSIGRKSKRLVAANGFEALRSQIRELLHGTATLEKRFDHFVGSVEGVEEKMRINFAGELLHFSQPERYWLWTNWVWDPDANTGALPLVVQQEVDLLGDTPGETYLRVGEAMAYVSKVGNERGFARVGHGAYGVDVFLACVYAVYMYTVFKVKLSDEFNRILPALPELTRRVLGVQKIGGGAV